jgi:plastocyanin
MRKLVLTAAALVVLAVGSTALAGSTNVSITSAGFTPQSTSIQAGDTVNWTNNDTIQHTVTVAGSSCSLSLQPNQSSSCAFPNAGTFAASDDSGHTGTVNVAANTRAVTLAASRKVGIFGDAMTLSGTVSSKAAGEHVSVKAAPVGGTPFTYDVVTTAGGNWTLQVQPRARTTYTATWDTAKAQTLTIDLRPRLTLQKVGRHQYLVVVLGNRSFAGKTLDIARRIGGNYVVYKHVPITRIARTTTTSVSYFVTVVPAGTHLRAFLPKSQTAPDYLDGHSNFVVQ